MKFNFFKKEVKKEEVKNEVKKKEGRKMKKQLTNRQRDVLKFIKKFIKDNGYSPTIRDIGEGLGISSPATVYDHIRKLRYKGYLKENKGFRTIVLADNQKEIKNEILADKITRNLGVNEIIKPEIIATVSEEQELFNKLDSEARNEILELMRSKVKTKKIEYVNRNVVNMAIYVNNIAHKVDEIIDVLNELIENE